MEKTFEIIDHTADIGVVAYGISIGHVFINAAVALFTLMMELDGVKEAIQRDIELTAEDAETLLVEWLNELIYIFDVEHIAFKRFEINSISNTEIRARCFGEKVTSERHRLKREVKAATYHMLHIGKDKGGYKVQVIFDI